MATLKRTPDVTETVVVKKGGVVLELSHEEAEGLAILLRGGVGVSTMEILGIYSLCKNFRDEGFGDEERRNWNKWTSTAQRTTL